MQRGQLIVVNYQGTVVNPRNSTQQVFGREFWDNHLALLDSCHAILWLNTHVDCGLYKWDSDTRPDKREKKKRAGTKGERVCAGMSS